MSRDLIDRKEIIGRLDRVIIRGVYDDFYEGHLLTAEVVKETILSLPSAEPETPSNGSITCINPEKTHVRTTDDLISRQAAIDAIVKLTNCNTPKVLKEYVAEHSLWSLWSGGVLEALEAVEALPSAPLYTEEEIQTMQDMEWSQMEKMYELGKEERKKGKWIDDGTELGCCCSECGTTLDDYFDGSLHEICLSKIPNFCPSCGSYNGGEDDGNK